MADRMAVMNKGRIEQLGSPTEIYERPSTRYVAAFIGSPAMNFIDGTIESTAGKPVFKWGDESIPLERYAFGTEARSGKATFGVRPEHLVYGDGARAQEFSGEFVVDMLEPMGSDTLAWCKSTGGQTIGLRAPTEMRLAEGDRIPIGITAHNASIFDTASGKRL